MTTWVTRGVALAAAALLGLPAAAAADNVVNDDEIVIGSLCAGTDCVDGEAFGFDTTRLKAPVLRLGFLDTSVTAGFPTNDWELTANDADGAGTGEFFAFTDVTAGTSPLRILAGAPTDTLQLAADGGVRLAHGPLSQRVDGTSTEGAAAADPASLRTALAGLPIFTYEFVADPANVRHLGPLAPDFNGAFGLGSGTEEIAPADVAGVALAVAKDLSIRVQDLTGPQGAKGDTGPVGPKGEPGPKGADGVPSEGLTTAKDRLAGLERRQRRLDRRNKVLRKRVKSLRKQVRRLRAAR